MSQELSGKKIAMVIAFNDFRDEEYFLPKETLEKAGAEVTTISNGSGMAKGAAGNQTQIDYLIDQFEVENYQAIVFIGGSGCLRNLDNQVSYKIANEAVHQNKLLAAICISPVILAKAGVVKGRKANVWSNAVDKSAVKTLKENGVIYQDEEVVIDGKIITANGPIATQKFRQAIIKTLTGFSN